MKNSLFSLLAIASLPFGVQAKVTPAQSDSAYLFAYSTLKSEGRNGLHFAWSTDRILWHEIGPEHAFVKSDYGPWGAQKRMLNPSVRWNTEKAFYEVVFELNEQEHKVAYCTTPDFVHWTPQDYYDRSVTDYFTNPKTELRLPSSGVVKGEMLRVAWPLVAGLISECQRAQYQAQIDGERAADDLQGRFRNLKPLQTSVRVIAEGQKDISDRLIGIFFEDINYGADGGLYAELVQNRDFEYTERENHRDKSWGPLKAWKCEGAECSIATADPIHSNNEHYVVVDAAAPSALLSNEGYDGIPVRQGEKYDFSLFGRVVEGKSGRVQVRLVSTSGQLLAQSSINLTKGAKWSRMKTVLKATASADVARLELCFADAGRYHLDMVSLFPQNTFRGRKNGLRRDLCEALAALKPRFVRFPGGCVSHGNGIDNIYHWQNSIGPLESRKPNWNIWGYHQTLGLGYYEYFQLCEDLGAEPLPVLAAGVPCQNSGVGGNGQQGGIPLDQMQDYIQEVLDLVEWANGDPKTSRWARMRAEAGHPKPFGLKMIGIGNEDLISDVFKQRFEMIYKAVRERYPELEVVGTVGPFWEGSDYEEGWRLANRLGIQCVDEHYYNSPGWFINHQDFYDSYRRGATKVYLGEYASHIPGRANCLETALSEALYLCSVERNADVVEMTSYAPLFARKGHTQWNPDMIYFDNVSVEPTTGYQVQRMFGQNAGSVYVPSEVMLSTSDSRQLGAAHSDVFKRIGVSVVKDDDTHTYVVKLVNYLPVANEVDVDLSSLQVAEGQPVVWDETVRGELLTGELADTRCESVPLTNARLESGKLKITLPAYSFGVVRLGVANVR